MKEFDFDELDRAVASLMDKAAPEAKKNDEKPGAEQAEPATTPTPQVSSVPSPSVEASETDDTAVKVFTPSSHVSAPDETSDNSSSPEEAPRGTEEESKPDAEAARTSPTPAHSVHQTVQFRPTSRSYASQPASSEADTTSEDTKDLPENADEPSEAQESASASKPKRIVPHRTGRFMDMKPVGSTRAPKTSSISSRQGVTIEPRSDAPLLDVVKPADNVDSELPETASDTARGTEPDISSASDFPDPIDVHTKKDSDEVAATTETPARESSTTEQPATSTTLGKTDYSAFLTDAKPEKRPLGGATPGADDQKSEDKASTEVPTNPDASNEPVHEEFDQKLMAIESGDIEKALPDGVEHHEGNTSRSTEPKTAKQDVASVPKAIESTPIRPTGPTSIPKQYEEQPSSGPDDNGAIFDTATYHQPLEHPAKKSRGWLWVLLIVIVIALGAGIGAVLYLGYL